MKNIPDFLFGSTFPASQKFVFPFRHPVYHYRVAPAVLFLNPLQHREEGALRDLWIMLWQGS
jgi:hypothetical protein